MNRDGTNSHSLSDKLDRDIQDPQWASDSSGVYVRYDDQGDSKIAFYSVDGTSKKIPDHLASTTRAGGTATFSLSHPGLLPLTDRLTHNPATIPTSTTTHTKLPPTLTHHP